MHYYYLDKENNYYCTSYLSCIEEYFKLLADKNQYILYDDGNEFINEKFKVY